MVHKRSPEQLELDRFNFKKLFLVIENTFSDEYNIRETNPTELQFSGSNLLVTIFNNRIHIQQYDELYKENGDYPKIVREVIYPVHLAMSAINELKTIFEMES